MSNKKIVHFRPREAPASIYSTLEDEQWFDNLLNSNRVMEILGKNQIQGAISSELDQ